MRIIKEEGDCEEKRSGFFRNPIFIVLLIIVILVFVYFAHSIYFVNSLNQSNKIESSVPSYYSDYGYYSVANFVNGSGYFNMIYYIGNDSWVMPENIDDKIHFNITNPQTGASVEGGYTPDLVVVNNTLYLDILVVNWNDTAQKGSCYQISDSASAVLSDSHDGSGYDWDNYYRSLDILSVEEYRKQLLIDEYDEIRIGVPVIESMGLLGDNDSSTGYVDCQYILFERDCAGSFRIGSQTAVACNVRIV